MFIFVNFCWLLFVFIFIFGGIKVDFFFFFGIFDKLFVLGSLGVFLVLIIFFKGKKIVYIVEIYNGR